MDVTPLCTRLVLEDSTVGVTAGAWYPGVPRRGRVSVTIRAEGD
jgi:hypothetical protein